MTGGKVFTKTLFQSTRPQGARRDSHVSFSGLLCFNPRARRGRDKPAKCLYTLYFVSIHAPAGGATKFDPEA